MKHNKSLLLLLVVLACGILPAMSMSVSSNSASLKACIEDCKKVACPKGENPYTGCNQMLSCPQACKIRDLGVSKQQCKLYCQRHGGSGCNLEVKGQIFPMCAECACGWPEGRPYIAECAFGCDAYDRDPMEQCLDEECNALEKCLDMCSAETCATDVKTDQGCNQMFSCPQGCKMRELGVSRQICEDKCERHGSSGCSPVINGFKFQLCGPCYREGGCAPWPTVEECKKGCQYY